MELKHSPKPKKPGCRASCKACRVIAAQKSMDIKGAFMRPLTAGEDEQQAYIMGYKSLKSKRIDEEKKMRASLGLRKGTRNKEGELEL